DEVRGEVERYGVEVYLLEEELYLLEELDGARVPPVAVRLPHAYDGAEQHVYVYRLLVGGERRHEVPVPDVLHHYVRGVDYGRYDRYDGHDARLVVPLRAQLGYGPSHPGPNRARDR